MPRLNSTESLIRKWHLSLFSCMWGGAVIFHLLSNDLYKSSWLDMSLFPVALIVMFWPARLIPLIILCALHSLVSVIQAPVFLNHQLFVSVINLSILGVFVCSIEKRSSCKISFQRFYQHFIPLLRLEFVILYFWAGFHKLNAGYFSCGSCAYYFFQQGEGLFSVPSNLLGFLPVMGILIEFLIPLCLILQRTRRLGILLALLFHGLLSLNPISGFYNFSAAIFALLILFVPPEIVENRKNVLIARLKVHKHFHGLVSLNGGYIRFGILAMGLAILFGTKFFGRSTGINPFLMLWCIYALGVFTFYVLLIWKVLPVIEENLSWTKRPVILLAFPFLLVMNGMSPYLGVKTETAFSMYSNLRTEPGYENHFLVPKTFKLFAFQDSLIEVLDSNHDYFLYLKNQGFYIPKFEVDRRIANDPTIWVDIVAKEKKELRHIHAANIIYPPFWQRKFLSMRPIPINDPSACIH